MLNFFSYDGITIFDGASGRPNFGSGVTLKIFSQRWQKKIPAVVSCPKLTRFSPSIAGCQPQCGHIGTRGLGSNRVPLQASQFAINARSFAVSVVNPAHIGQGTGC
jgi:hypothetical protein